MAKTINAILLLPVCQTAKSMNTAVFAVIDRVDINVSLSRQRFRTPS